MGDRDKDFQVEKQTLSIKYFSVESNARNTSIDGNSVLYDGESDHGIQYFHYNFSCKLISSQILRRTHWDPFQ